MDDIPDRTHVTLWVREYEAYLVAAEDGEGVACLPGYEPADSPLTHGALHGAWAVHRVVRGDDDYVLFHSAVYGRYLAIVQPVQDEALLHFHQRTYDSPEQVNVLFQARGADDGSDDIHMTHFTFGDLCHPDDEYTAMPGPWPLNWVVEAIPARPLPPELPHPIPAIPTPVVPMCHRHVQLQPPQAVLRRRINYVQADDQANFNNPLQWRVLEQFEGQSVFNLRRALAAELGEADNYLGITLCVSGGSNGRWTPLVVDLPFDENAMNIVVLTTGSPAAQELVYPDVDEL